MLHVSHGPFRLLEQAFIDRLKTLQSADKLAKLAVVAPSRRLADRLQRLVAVEAGLSVLNVHFHTFYSLALSILEEEGAGERKFLGDPVFHDRLLDSLLDKHPELAERFGGATRPRALASALRSSLKDLIDAGVNPKEVVEHFSEAYKGFPKLQGLLELQETYQAWQKRHNVFGSSGLPVLAAEAAEGSKLLASFKEIVYYGFYDLTGLQLEIFNASGARDEAWKASKEILKLRNQEDVLGPRLRSRWGRIMGKLGIAAGWLVWQGRLKAVEEAALGPALPA